MTIRLQWMPRVTADEQRVYRSTSPFGRDNLPPIFATLGATEKEYLDETATSGGATYYYMLGVVSGANVALSDLVSAVNVESGVSSSVVSFPATWIASVPLVNPGAETGDLTGWTNVGNGIDINSTLAQVKSGSFSFFGPEAVSGSAYQDYTVSDTDVISAIDAGEVYSAVHYWQGEFNNDDRANIKVEFYDGSDVLLDTDPGFGLKDRPSMTGQSALPFLVPANTRKIRYIQEYSRIDGTRCDSVIDDIEAYLYKVGASPSEVSITITNPGAETGDLTGWVEQSNGVDVFGPDSASAASGDYWFRGANSDSFGRIYQDVALSAGQQAAADSGLLLVKLGWQQSSFDGLDEVAGFLEFRGSGGTNLGRVLDEIGNNMEALGSEGPRVWVAKDIGWHRVPAGTEEMRIWFTFDRTAGLNNDGAVDDVELVAFEVADTVTIV